MGQAEEFKTAERQRPIAKFNLIACACGVAGCVLAIGLFGGQANGKGHVEHGHEVEGSARALKLGWDKIQEGISVNKERQHDFMDAISGDYSADVIVKNSIKLYKMCMNETVNEAISIPSKNGGKAFTIENSDYDCHKDPPHFFRDTVDKFYKMANGYSLIIAHGVFSVCGYKDDYGSLMAELSNVFEHSKTHDYFSTLSRVTQKVCGKMVKYEDEE